MVFETCVKRAKRAPKKTRQTLRLLWSQRQHAQGHHREAFETHPNLPGRVLTNRAELSTIAIFH